MMEKDDLERRAEAFAAEYSKLVKEYFGDLEEQDFEPFGMKLREVLPVRDAVLGGTVTTTKTISLPLDTDPADQDEPLSFTS